MLKVRDSLSLTSGFVFFFLISCSSNTSITENSKQGSPINAKEELLSLERKWLDAEFILDTAYISTLMDTTFIDISPDHIHNKQQALKAMYDNISAMRKDSIFLDSLNFKDVTVNLYENTAVIVLVTHSYKKDKSKPIEKRMRFYDVWINRNSTWKAVSSQGTTITE